MTLKGKILVTPRSVTVDGHPALQRCVDAGFEIVMGPAGRQPTEEELIELLPGCVGYLAGVEPVTARVLAVATELNVISRNGVGMDNIDAAAAATKQIHISTAAGSNARGVSELTLGLMLGLARNLPENHTTLREGQWVRRRGFELEGKTLGLVGCGRIGQLVAHMGKALGMTVTGFDPFAETLAGRDLPIRFAPMDEVIAGADIVSLHCPPPDDGKPIINEAAIASTRAGVLLINTARFDLIDELAVLAGLNSGQIGGLGLDVFAEEPPRDLTLLQHPRVIATSHVGGFTNESVDRAMDQAVSNLLEKL